MAKTEEVLRNLRKICLALPETVEVVSWGHPTYRAGRKAYVVLDEYHHTRCIAFGADSSLKEVLLEDPRFFRAPSADKHGWICLRADGKLDCVEVQSYLLRSYRLAALKRMLSKLEDFA